MKVLLQSFVSIVVALVLAFTLFAMFTQQKPIGDLTVKELDPIRAWERVYEEYRE